MQLKEVAAEGVGAGEALEVAEEVAAEGENGGRFGIDPREGQCAAAVVELKGEVAAGQGNGIGHRAGREGEDRRIIEGGAGDEEGFDAGGGHRFGAGAVDNRAIAVDRECGAGDGLGQEVEVGLAGVALAGEAGVEGDGRYAAVFGDAQRLAPGGQIWVGA